jgi:hypothetical protein
MLLNHTGCGFTTFTDEELNAKLCASTGDATPAPMRLDRERRSRARLYLRCGHGSLTGSDARRARECRGRSYSLIELPCSSVQGRAFGFGWAEGTFMRICGFDRTGDGGRFT